jgi:hypothetical protein
LQELLENPNLMSDFIEYFEDELDDLLKALPKLPQREVQEIKEFTEILLSQIEKSIKNNFASDGGQDAIESLVRIFRLLKAQNGKTPNIAVDDEDSKNSAENSDTESIDDGVSKEEIVRCLKETLKVC